MKKILYIIGWSVSILLVYGSLFGAVVTRSHWWILAFSCGLISGILFDALWQYEEGKPKLREVTEEELVKMGLDNQFNKIKEGL